MESCLNLIKKREICKNNKPITLSLRRISKLLRKKGKKGKNCLRFLRNYCMRNFNDYILFYLL